MSLLLALTGDSTNTQVTPAVGTVTLTGYAPVIAQSGSTDSAVNPGVGSIALTGYAPAIAQPKAVVPAVGSIAITGYTPSILQPQAIAPAAGSIAITGYAPTILQPQALSPGVGNIALTGYVPSVVRTANQALVPGAGSIAITGYSPSVGQTTTGDTTINPGVGTLAITGYAPSVEQAEPAISGRSSISRQWLIDYYTEAFAKKEIAPVAQQVTKPVSKRKQTAEIKKLVAKAEKDLDKLTAGVKDAEAVQRFLLVIITQVQIQLDPGVDFLSIADDYRKRIQQEDDELLLLSMVI